MANREQFKILLQGPKVWNDWRNKFPDAKIDLSEVDLHEADLRYANLIEADLHGAILSRANLSETILIKANLNEVDLREASIFFANLHGATIFGSDLRKANLIGSDLSMVQLIGVDLQGACISGCNVFGISAWELNLKNTMQKDLGITFYDEPYFTIDNIELAQFIYLLLHSQKIRNTIDAITMKVVLILGRFTNEQKPILDAIKEKIRARGYAPILFDFEGPERRDTRETISILAHISKFIIADITDARSISAELECIVPQLPSVPIQPLINNSDYEYGLFNHIMRFPWVLEPYRYRDQGELLDSIDQIIATAEAKLNEIAKQNH